MIDADPSHAPIGARGRPIHGVTQPGAFTPCARETPLSSIEVGEVVDLIARGRLQRQTIELPERLQTRSWDSVAAVVLALEQRLPWDSAGWKVGAASADVRAAEGVPGPSPGRIFRRGVLPSGSRLPAELFVNYRLCECEFAFELDLDFPPRARPYTEDDARAGIATLFPAVEIGDSVFGDWYAASGYFGTCLDNGGGAAFVEGSRIKDWQTIDLAAASMDLFLNGQYIKSGRGQAAMGHPVTSLTWMLNWLRERGRGTIAGEVVSTGTCTGHCFVAPGDHVCVDFGDLGVVEAGFD